MPHKKIVKVDLRGDEIERFNEIKDEIGVTHDSEVLRFLIKRFSSKVVEVPA